MNGIDALFSKSCDQISELFKEYADNDDIDVSYFEKMPGSKLNDHLAFLNFLTNKFNANVSDFSAKGIYNKSIEGIERKYSHKLVFFSNIFEIFSKELGESFDYIDNLNDVILSIFKHSKVSPESISYFANKFSVFLSNSNPSTIIKFSDWFSTAEHTDNLMKFLQKISFPKDLIKNEDAVHYINNVANIFASKTSKDNTDSIMTACFNLLRQVHISSSSEIKESIEKVLKINSSNAESVSIAMYATADDVFESLNEKLDCLGCFVAPKCLPYSLYVINDFCKKGVENKDIFQAILSSFLCNIYNVQLSDDDNALLGKLLLHLFETSRELFDFTMSSYLQSSNLSAEVIHALENSGIDLDVIITDDIIKMTPILKSVARLADHSFTNPKLMSVMSFALKIMNKMLQFLKTYERLDDNKALLAALSGNQDPVELAIQDIPFRRVEIFALLFCLHKNIEVRKMSYSLLEAISEVFKAANTDWKTYDQYDQPTIMRLEADLKFVSKKQLKRDATKEDFLAMDELRLSSICYATKKMAMQNYEIVPKLFKLAVKLSSIDPIFIEVVVSMYCDQAKQALEQNFISAKDLINLMVKKSQLKSIESINAKMIPTLVSGINKQEEPATLIKIIRYVTKVMSDNPRSFNKQAAITLKTLFKGVVKNGIEGIDQEDLAIALGSVAKLKLAGKEVEVIPVDLDVEDMSDECKEAMYNYELDIIISDPDYKYEKLPILAENSPTDITYNFCLELIKRVPNRALAIIESILIYSPTAVCNAILKAKSPIFDEVLTIFALLMCDTIETQTITLLQDYVKELHPEQVPFFADMKNTSPIKIIIKNLPEFIESVLARISRYFSPEMNGLRIYHLSTLIIELLGAYNDVKDNVLREIIYVAIALGSEKISFSSLINEIWQSIITTKQRAFFVVDTICSVAPAEYVMDTVFKNIKDEWKHDIVVFLHEKILRYIEDSDYTDYVRCAFRVNSNYKLCPELILEIAIFLDLKDVMLNYIAKLVVNSKLKDIDAGNQKASMDIIGRVVKVCNEKTLKKVTEGAYIFLTKTKNLKAFNGVVALIVNIMITKSHDKNIEEEILKFLDTVFNRFDKNEKKFGQFFTSLFKAFADLMECGGVEPSIINIIVNFGFNHVFCPYREFTNSFVNFFTNGYSNGLIKIDPNEYIDSIASLLIFGGIISITIYNIFFNEKDFSSIKNPVSLLWIKIHEGTAILESSDINEETIETFKKAMQFGNQRIVDKLESLLLYRKLKLSEEQRKILADLEDFALTCNNAAPSRLNPIIRGVNFQLQ